MERLKGGGDDYSITIIGETVEPLEPLAKFAAERGSKFVSLTNGALNYSPWRKHLDAARAKTEAPYTAHGLGHVCASLLIVGGISIELVAEQMGDKSPNVTRRVYCHALHIDRTELARELNLPKTAITVDRSAESK